MSVIGHRTVGSEDDDYVAIDFETATPEPHSVCAVGIAEIVDGRVEDAHSWLVRPRGNLYAPRLSGIHGITADLTESASSFETVWQILAPRLRGRILMAHWASFDMRVLRASCMESGLELPDVRFVCSCRISQRLLSSLPNHRLPTVCERLGIPLDHHDAGSDAAACAELVVRLRDSSECASIAELIRKAGVRCLPLR